MTLKISAIVCEVMTVQLYQCRPPWFLPYNTFNRGKMGITLAHQGCILKTKNPVEVLI